MSPLCLAGATLALVSCGGEKGGGEAVSAASVPTVSVVVAPVVQKTVPLFTELRRARTPPTRSTSVPA